MKELSLLIGGEAGDGINQAGALLAKLLSRLGYFVYVDFDYPSLIRGGHNFATIRASRGKITSCRNRIDYIIALNQETIILHRGKLKEASKIIYDADKVKSEGTGLALAQMLKEENAKPIMRNSCLVGAFAKSVGIARETLETIIRNDIAKDTEVNIRLALKGYEQAQEQEKLEVLQKEGLPVLTGSEAVGLGLISAGLKTYIAYPMTPSSGLLHFLAKVAPDFNIQVIHPENEIAVMLMALGFSYAGARVAVGTSGGGFCLMTEGLSLSGMAELPIVIMMSQRPGPSTGMPTYTSQGDLHFVLHAGHGEFARFVVAPGDAEEAYFWAGTALNIAWKYQMPSFILSDKTLNEGVVSFDKGEAGSVAEEKIPPWDGKAPYKRYAQTDNGVSPLAFPSDEGALVKVNSYEHDEFGITIEDVASVTAMGEKRLRKEKALVEELKKYKVVATYGKENSATAILCWGSNKGPAREVAETLGLKVIQPIILSPFPIVQLREALTGVTRLIAVENNATGQLARLVAGYGIKVDENILSYDGRAFTVEALEERVKKVLS